MKPRSEGTSDPHAVLEKKNLVELAVSGILGRERALKVIESKGSSSVGFQSLETGYAYAFLRTKEKDLAVLAYLESFGHRLVVGMPSGEKRHIKALIVAFLADAENAGLRTLFVAVEQGELDILKSEGFSTEALKVGEQPEWQPAQYDIGARERRSLRAQVRRAQRKGVTVRRIEPEVLIEKNSHWLGELDAVQNAWAASRKLSVLRFMVSLEPLTYSSHRRYYFAEHRGRCVGFLAAVPVFGKRGWFFEDLLRAPDTPNGTMEFLVHRAMEDARLSGDQYVTLGLAPMAGIEKSSRPPLADRLLHASRSLEALYGFQGLFAFKNRFRPDTWTPVYVVSLDRAIGVRSLWALFLAFVPQGVGSFLVDSIRRALIRLGLKRWSIVIHMLASLLIPWTVLLALCDGERWFGDASIKWAWVAFDTGMFAALVWLGSLIRKASKWAHTVALLLTGATLSDSVLSVVQGINLHGSASGWPAVLVTVGMLGPIAATIVLACLCWSGVVGKERH